MAILVTGGAGYIGTHTIINLLDKGYDIVVIDNLSNSSKDALTQVEKITGKKVIFYHGDIRDNHVLKDIFSQNTISDVIHFAGLKAVGESVTLPLKYYDNNISGTLCLLNEMLLSNVKSIIFSSSATVYGLPRTLPIKESDPLGQITNPYGRTKIMAENILKDITKAIPDFRTTILRYFNPVGAHPSGLIGENPKGIPNNLFPVISQTILGRNRSVNIFGSDYATPDGTGIRDYIHVMDLAAGHFSALDKQYEGKNFKVYNLGTGKGYSVLQIINEFEKQINKKIKIELCPRREGDIAQCWSSPDLAFEELRWKAQLSLEDMIRDTLNWLNKYPSGY
ncbi:UDP-glucose 4-epimerase GalE [Salmonella enterica subsp. enterica serovar Baguida]|uniref:UDP-glucose 4-epimerase n=1 Tax=Salmonella enterica subsp. houtenae serovar 21:z4,z23:- TaxID=1967606 RepID=A0A752MNV6_SALHO|nr:UDP-glucose 4-epimerase GalE [Salmonella enterica]ECC9580838.1 UDP-glucose 4-epimerase GalE [Salmonella enterica subsp. houtenae]ECG5958994.1 UDP-glucose 4-epimerase GalE [Salmonella enterica subsp. enterica serovar Baguida]HAF7510558.1 UDP-glucose 4-epimerase GalE [Salmonella enterica subsp. houtenae serovar 21:z4,z23:-]ECJ6125019.1 UDP-glucose 4-epimerase GalE [Salmonella enterica]